MSTRRPRHFPLPSHWSAAQADAVVEILVILLDAVTYAYDDALHHLDESALDPLSDGEQHADFEDDPIPF